MPGVTIEVVDPQKGQKRRIALIRRGGRTFLQEIKNTDRAAASALRLERDAQFAEAATKAFGNRKVSGLPPAAEAVGSAEFPGPRSRDRPHPGRLKRQSELRSLVGEGTLRRMTDQLASEVCISLQTPSHRYKPPRGVLSFAALSPEGQADYLRQASAEYLRLQNRRFRKAT